MIQCANIIWFVLSLFLASFRSVTPHSQFFLDVVSPKREKKIVSVEFVSWGARKRKKQEINYKGQK